MNREEIINSNKELLDFYNKLKKLKAEFDSAFKNKLNRSLSFSDLLFDRWERATFLGFGKGTSIYDSSVVLGDVVVGENTWIGPFTVLDGSGKLSIGNNCSISSGVQIYSHDTVKWAITGGQEGYEYGETKIGNNVYIGPNVIIAKGVIIEDGCIIGANSFVNKSFKANTKLAGSPAKEIE